MKRTTYRISTYTELISFDLTISSGISEDKLLEYITNAGIGKEQLRLYAKTVEQTFVDVISYQFVYMLFNNMMMWNFDYVVEFFREKYNIDLNSEHIQISNINITTPQTYSHVLAVSYGD